MLTFDLPSCFFFFAKKYVDLWATKICLFLQNGGVCSPKVNICSSKVNTLFFLKNDVAQRSPPSREGGNLWAMSNAYFCKTVRKKKKVAQRSTYIAQRSPLFGFFQISFGAINSRKNSYVAQRSPPTLLAEPLCACPSGGQRWWKEGGGWKRWGWGSWRSGNQRGPAIRALGIFLGP